MHTPISILAILVLGAAMFTGCQEREAITKELENAKNNVVNESARIQENVQNIQEGYQQVKTGIDATAKTLQDVSNAVDSVTSHVSR